MTGHPEGAAPKGSRSLIIAVVAAFIAFAAWIALSSGRGPVDITAAFIADEETLHLNVASCNGEPEVTLFEVDEATGLVFVAVTSDQNSKEDCLDSIAVVLPPGTTATRVVDMKSDTEFDLTEN